MNCMVLVRTDGSLIIVALNPNNRLPGESDSDFETRAFTRTKQANGWQDLASQVIPPSAIPTDRTFRNAWRWNGSAIVVDMPAARTLHRAKLRLMRKPKFEFWDVEWMKETATGDTAAASAAEAKRVELRNCPQHPSIDSATTPDELKAAIPPCLA